MLPLLYAIVCILWILFLWTSIVSTNWIIKSNQTLGGMQRTDCYTIKKKPGRRDMGDTLKKSVFAAFCLKAAAKVWVGMCTVVTPCYLQSRVGFMYDIRWSTDRKNFHTGSNWYYAELLFYFIINPYFKKKSNMGKNDLKSQKSWFKCIPIAM